VVSNIPKYPRSSIVKMDFVTFSLACFSVLLKAPRLNLALVSRKLAFSSYLRAWPAIFSAKTSMRSVSSCVFVKWLFLEIIVVTGSLREAKSQIWTSSLSFKFLPRDQVQMDTVSYTRVFLKASNRFIDKRSVLAQGFYAEEDIGWLRNGLWSQDLSPQDA